MKTQAPWNLLSKLLQAITISGYTSIGALLAICLVGFVPQMEGPQMRRFVSKKVAELRPQDYPEPIIHKANGSSFRAPVNKSARREAVANIPQNTANVTAWLQFSPQSILLNTVSGQKNLNRAASTLALVLAQDIYTFTEEPSLLTTQPLAYGEALTHTGTPLRWKTTQASHAPQVPVTFDPMCDLERPSMEDLQAKLLARAYSPRRGESYVSMARRYQHIVKESAQRFRLRPSLIFSIIHTESNFRPRLVSSAAAMGLMQLLPTTAGGEVHKYLYGHTTDMSLEELSQPEINIKFGSAYFYLLMTRHLHGIHDARSREYCAIAAYNMGIGRLMRYFGGMDTAFSNINALSSQEVYRQLTQVLPIAETRAYVLRVSQRENFYRNM